jgi:forkhead box protein K
LTAQLLADPPIVMHEGELILNPTIFATLPKETLDALRKLPAGKALPTLQAHVVQHLKDQLKKKGMPKPSTFCLHF